jgi:uncharacterized membrane protein
VTAPIVDRVAVEILPLFKGFDEKLKSNVATSVGTVGKELDKVSQSVESTTKKAAEHTEGLFSHVKESAKSLFTFMAPMALGFGAVEFIKGAVEAAADAAKLNRQTAAAIASTGSAAHVTAGEVEEYATKLSEQSGVQDDVIKNNENLLLTFTNIRNEVGKGNDIFTQATSAVLDMSVALKEDGKSASIQLGKALNDPIKGITALSRVGVAFTAEQKETIKTMVAHNDMLGAQKVILAELNKEFGGSAAAQASAGAKMAASYHHVEEEVGTRLLPVIAKFSTFVTTTIIPTFLKLFDQASRGEGVFGTLSSIFSTLRVILTPLVELVISFVKKGWGVLGEVLKNDVLPVLTTVSKYMSKHGDDVRAVVTGVLALVAAYKVWAIITKTMTAVQAALDLAMDANPIGIVVLAVVALTAALVYAYFHSKRFREIVDDVGRISVRVGKDIYQFFINLYHVGVTVWHALETSGEAIGKFFGSLWSKLVQAWNSIWKFLATWGPVALAVLVPFIGIPLLIYQHWNQIIGFMKKVWDGAYNAVVGGIKNVMNEIGTIKQRVLNFFIGAEVWLVVTGVHIIQGLHNGVVNTWHVVTEFFSRILASIGNAIGRASDWAYNVGRDIINGLWHGVQAVWNDVVGWFGKIPGWIKSALGIHSPPSWAVDAGGWIVKGLIKGLIGGEFNLATFIAHFASMAQKKIALAFTSIRGTVVGGAQGLVNLINWIQTAEQLTGVGPSWTPGLMTLIGRESGGNPNSINTTDINAQRGDPSRGLMQTIGATFSQYHLPGTSWNIYDPVANIAAGIRYIQARYGGIGNVQQANPNKPPLGYAAGAWNVPYDQLAYIHAREMVVPAAPAEKIRAGVHKPMDLSDDTIDKLGDAIGRALNGVSRRALVRARQAG